MFFDIFGNEILSRFLTSTFEGILTEIEAKSFKSGGAGGRGGGCQAVKDSKDKQFDTPSTCRRQGRQILSASRHPAALRQNCRLKCKRPSKSDFGTFLATFLVALGLILEVSG